MPDSYVEKALSYIDNLITSDRTKGAIIEAFNSDDDREFATRLRSLPIPDNIKYDIRQLRKGETTHETGVLNDVVSSRPVQRMKSIGRGIAGAVSDPRNAAYEISGLAGKDRTMKALADKNYPEAAYSAIGAVPLVGGQLEGYARTVGGGDVPGAISDIATDIATGAAAGKVIGAGAKRLSAGTKELKRGVTQTLPEAVYGKVFKDTPEDILDKMKSIASGKTENPELSKEVLQRGYRGSLHTMGVQMFKDLNDLNASVARVAASTTPFKYAQKAGVEKLLSNIAGAYSKDIVTSEATHAQTLLKRLRDTPGEYLSPSLAVDIKRFVDAMRQQASFRAESQMVGSHPLSDKMAELRTVGNDLRAKLEEANPKISNLLNEQRIRIQALGDIGKEAARIGGKPLVSLLDAMALSAGGVVGAPGMGAGGVAALHMVQSPHPMTYIAQKLYKAGGGETIPLPRGEFTPRTMPKALPPGAMPLGGPSQPPTEGLKPAVSHTVNETLPRNIRPTTTWPDNWPTESRVVNNASTPRTMYTSESQPTKATTLNQRTLTTKAVVDRFGMSVNEAIKKGLVEPIGRNTFKLK